MNGAARLALGLALAASFARTARADADAGALLDAGAALDASPAASAADAAAPVESVSATCIEHLASGAARPAMRERIASKGTSGWALPLTIEIEHGKGETVLSQGLRTQSGGDAARALEAAGFALPDPDGGAGPTTKTVEAEGKATTTLTLSFVPLPTKPGRATLTLPPLPIALARASGEVVTLCTAPHVVSVEDPIASIPDARPKPNPAPRSQIEEWVLARWLTIGALVGAVVAALLAWLIARWRRRPKPVAPPPPPRPPWEVALEELFAVRHAGLVGEARFAEHFDRVSDALRKYLGGRYGFDGLETTTFEMTRLLSLVDPPIPERATIEGLLQESDLVKFAKLVPSEEDCGRVLDLAERVVRVTIPAAALGPAAMAGVAPPPAAPLDGGPR